MNADERKAYAVSILHNMQMQLRQQGIDRLPQRSDFAPEDVVLLKAAFGPFPRALEAAGLKPVRGDHAEKQRQRRIAAKRKRTAARRNHPPADQDEGEI